MLIDEGSLEEVGEVVIRDRKHISEDGIVLPIIAINKQTGMIEIPPEMVFRGVAFSEEERLVSESRQLVVDTVNGLHRRTRRLLGHQGKDPQGPEEVLLQADGEAPVHSAGDHGNMNIFQAIVLGAVQG